MVSDRKTSQTHLRKNYERERENMVQRNGNFWKGVRDKGQAKLVAGANLFSLSPSWLCILFVSASLRPTQSGSHSFFFFF